MTYWVFDISTYILVAIFVIFVFLFGVPMVDDKVELIYKHDSKIIKSLVEKSNITKLNFKVCIAGTFALVQMVTMLIVELFYHKCRK